MESICSALKFPPPRLLLQHQLPSSLLHFHGKRISLSTFPSLHSFSQDVAHPLTLDVEEPLSPAQDIPSNQLLQPFEEGLEMIRVKFVLERKCRFGECFCVVGNHPQLGNWNTEEARSMDWSEGHIWNVELSVPADMELEFKCIRKDKKGEVVEWQHGPNRAFQTVKDVSPLVVHVPWEMEDSAHRLAATSNVAEEVDTENNTVELESAQLEAALKSNGIILPIPSDTETCIAADDESTEATQANGKPGTILEAQASIAVEINGDGSTRLMMVEEDICEGKNEVVHQAVVSSVAAHHLAATSNVAEGVDTENNTAELESAQLEAAIESNGIILPIPSVPKTCIAADDESTEATTQANGKLGTILEAQASIAVEINGKDSTRLMMVEEDVCEGTNEAVHHAVVSRVAAHHLAAASNVAEEVDTENNIVELESAQLEAALESNGIILPIPLDPETCIAADDESTEATTQANGKPGTILEAKASIAVEINGKDSTRLMMVEEDICEGTNEAVHHAVVSRVADHGRSQADDKDGEPAAIASADQEKPDL